MARYEKWLGASLGWVMTGNPLGGLLGFIAGSLIESGEKKSSSKITEGISEFEMNLRKEKMLRAYHVEEDGEI